MKEVKIEEAQLYAGLLLFLSCGKVLNRYPSATLGADTGIFRMGMTGNMVDSRLARRALEVLNM